MTEVDFSVIVCTRLRPVFLARCLASLNALEYRSHEVIVVDNTPGGGPTEAAAVEAGARYVREPREGLSRARNTGARVAHGRVIAYIDDDAVADPRWLTHQAVAFRDPRITAVTGRVLPLKNNTSAAQRWMRFGGDDLGTDPFEIDRETPEWFERLNFGGAGLGGNIAFRRELFDAGWQFRESLGLGAPLPGGEEHFAFFTVVRGGGTIAYLPKAVVHHRIPDTMAAVRQRERWVLRAAAAYLTMLIVEEPDFRRPALRYAWEAARGKRRPWRPGESMRFGSPVQRLAAAGAGLVLYVRSRIPSRA